MNSEMLSYRLYPERASSEPKKLTTVRGESIAVIPCEMSQRLARRIVQRAGFLPTHPMRSNESLSCRAVRCGTRVRVDCQSQRIAIKAAPKWSVTSFSSLNTDTKPLNANTSGTRNSVASVIHVMIESIRAINSGEANVLLWRTRVVTVGYSSTVMSPPPISLWYSARSRSPRSV